jgi:anaerobic ribonucleoside-triphosphate reductase
MLGLPYNLSGMIVERGFIMNSLSSNLEDYLEIICNYINSEKNIKAIEQIIDYAFKTLDIPYLAFNFPIDSCLDCGYQGEFNHECPECNSENIQQLRRVTGYLTTDYRNFNKGKRAETEARVKHSLCT